MRGCAPPSQAGGYLNDNEDPADWGADLQFDTVQALHHWLRYELT